MQAVQPSAQPAQPSPPPTSTRRVPATTFPHLRMLRSERWLIGSFVLVALAALAPGILMGPFQAFRRSPGFMEMFPDWTIPIFEFYYQSLTVHGVMNALFFTTFFIVGVSYFVVQRSLQRVLWNTGLAWASFGAMVLGLLSTGYAVMIDGRSNILYTFYPPMIAQPPFYIGLLLLVLGTWMAGANIFKTYQGWKHDHPGQTVPLAVYGVLANFLMWAVATVSVAILIIAMLIPASFKWVELTDPQLARVLFWFFGHPLVYFWLFLAYISWYTMLPTQAGGKLFSDSLGRVSMLMLAVFSVPVGVHHLFSDPGVSEVAKGIHAFLTFIVTVPSLLTAFNIGAALERAGRRHGAKGWFDCLWKQDWGNPVVSAQIGALLLFIAGGFSGIIQASYTLNIALHNTAWVPAHFHMTLASAATLTYISIVYWIVPLIRGRALWSRALALLQVFTWVGGMAIFGHGMGAAGIEGVRRRTDMGSLFGDEGATIEAAHVWLNTTAVGAAILLISAVLLYVNIVGTLFFSRKPVGQDVPISTSGNPGAPLWFERWFVWLGVMLLLALVAWGPVFLGGILYFDSPLFNPSGTPLR